MGTETNLTPASDYHRERTALEFDALAAGYEQQANRSSTKRMAAFWRDKAAKARSHAANLRQD